VRKNRSGLTLFCSVSLDISKKRLQCSAELSHRRQSQRHSTGNRQVHFEMSTAEQSVTDGSKQLVH